MTATGRIMYPFDVDRPERRIRAVQHAFRVAPGAPSGVFERAELVLTFADEAERSLSITPQSGGVFLTPACGYEGWQQGEWKGAYNQEYATIQLADADAVRAWGHVTKAAQDQVGDDVGYGVCEFFPDKAPA